MKHDSHTLVLVTALLALLGAPAIRAQQAGVPARAAGVGSEQQQQMPDMQQQAPTDPILQLNLSAEQRQKIRMIREQTKAERAANNERLRETNQALETALDADNPDEAVLEQRVRDAAAAQSAAMRMRILTEVRIRRVLTLEQLGILRTLRQQARDSRRNRMLDNANGQRQQGNRPRIQNQRNGIAPLFPRRALQRQQQP
jgi:Spy/CpxP family protein refolding chaperone